MSNLSTAEVQAAWHLIQQQPRADLVLRSWHGARIVDGRYQGLHGFLFRCTHNPSLFRILRPAMQGIICCIPLSSLAGSPTRHGGVPCPGDSCTEGEPL